MNELIKLELITTSLKVKELQYSAIKDLKKVLANNPIIARDAYEQIIPILETDGDKWFRIAGVAIQALNEVLHSDPSLAKDIYDHVIPFLKYCSNDATASALCILTDIVIYERSFANEELLEKTQSFLSEDDIDVTGSANYLAGLINGILITKK
jgi:hypothetical protein